jgi:hypothetical protein
MRYVPLPTADFRLRSLWRGISPGNADHEGQTRPNNNMSDLSAKAPPRLSTPCGIVPQSGRRWRSRYYFAFSQKQSGGGRDGGVFIQHWTLNG